ncbi:MAG: sigma-70 family RNA polymerase sigma factor [Planctomycetes bacterium]|nr:sigma-70 family RNA polymerase sigma factor [Planctomycetota bacterium]
MATHDQDQEERLLARASQGDGVAIDQLVVRHLPALMTYVRVNMGEQLRHKESCADVVQSVCREALAESGRFEYRGEAAFRKWLYALATSKLRDRFRYFGAEKRDAARELHPQANGLDLSALLPSFTTPSQVAIRGEDMQQLEVAFAKLPEEYRQVVVSARILGMPHAEIAAEMGRSEGAVRVLLHRALVRLGWLLSAARPTGE